MSVNVDSSRSTSGYVMTYAGGAVSWQSRLQKFMALSTTEVEYMAAVEAGKEVIWMKDFTRELRIQQKNFDSAAKVKVPFTLRRTRPTPGSGRR